VSSTTLRCLQNGFHHKNGLSVQLLVDTVNCNHCVRVLCHSACVCVCVCQSVFVCMCMYMCPSMCLWVCVPTHRKGTPHSFRARLVALNPLMGPSRMGQFQAVRQTLCYRLLGSCTTAAGCRTWADRATGSLLLGRNPLGELTTDASAFLPMRKPRTGPAAGRAH
jgi:hypothetical protein